MLEIIAVLILFAIALALAYKIGTLDGISYTVDWLEKKGLMSFKSKK
jgi:hypothetical protein